MAYTIGELLDALKFAPRSAEVVLRVGDAEGGEDFYPIGVSMTSYKTDEPWTAKFFVLAQESPETEEETYERRFWRVVNMFREELEEEIVGLPHDHELVKLFDRFIEPIDRMGDMANE